MSELGNHDAMDMDDEMDELELALTQALRRVDAPEGFAEKVMGRVYAGTVAASTHVSEARHGAPGRVAASTHISEARHGAPGRVAASTHVSEARHGAPGRVAASAGSRGEVVVMRRRWAWVGGAIAAVLALGMFGAEQLHQQRERAAAANEQFEAAVRVTDHALAQTRAQLQRAGLRLGE